MVCFMHQRLAFMFYSQGSAGYLMGASMWGVGKQARGMARAGACMPLEISTRVSGRMMPATGVEAAHMLVEISTRVRESATLRLTDTTLLADCHTFTVGLWLRYKLVSTYIAWTMLSNGFLLLRRPLCTLPPPPFLPSWVPA